MTFDASTLVSICEADIGHPYVYGAWDCSGAVNTWIKRAGLKGPASPRPVVMDYVDWMEAYNVPNNTVSGGDLVIRPGWGPAGHIGIAVSDTEMVSALNSVEGTLKTIISSTMGPVWITRRIKGEVQTVSSNKGCPGSHAAAAMVALVTLIGRLGGNGN